MTSSDKNRKLRQDLINFSLKIIQLMRSLPKNHENSVISYQIIKSSTSMGANYSEAIFALTKPDFIHSINICKKESSESLHWLEILAQLYPENKLIPSLINECESYLKIFIATVKTAQSKK